MLRKKKLGRIFGFGSTGVELGQNLNKARAGLSGQVACEQRLEEVLVEMSQKRLKHQQVIFYVHLEPKIHHYPFSSPALFCVLCRVNLHGGLGSITRGQCSQLFFPRLLFQENLEIYVESHPYQFPKSLRNKDR